MMLALLILTCLVVGGSVAYVRRLSDWEYDKKLEDYKQFLIGSFFGGGAVSAVAFGHSGVTSPRDFVGYAVLCGMGATAVAFIAVHMYITAQNRSISIDPELKCSELVTPKEE